MIFAFFAPSRCSCERMPDHRLLEQVGDSYGGYTPGGVELQMDRPLQYHPWRADGGDEQQHCADLAAGNFSRLEREPAGPLRERVLALDDAWLYGDHGHSAGDAGPVVRHVGPRAAV